MTRIPRLSASAAYEQGNRDARQGYESVTVGAFTIRNEKYWIGPTIYDAYVAGFLSVKFGNDL